MYQAAVAALTGELFGKNLRSLIATALLAPAAWCLAQRYLFAAPAASALGNPVGFLFMVVLALQLAAIFAYVDLTAGSKSAGFPKHILLLPVPTWLLALVPILAGSVFTSGFVLLWLRYVSGVQLGWTQQVTIATAIVSVMCWVQAMSWELLPPRWLRVVVLVVVVIAAILSVLSFLATDSDFLFGAAGGAVGLAATALGGFSLAYVAVSRSRRGESLDLGSWIRRSAASVGLFSGTPRLPSLSGAIAAQDWYEWQVYGRFVPTFIILLVVGPLAAMLFAGPRQAPSFIFPAMILSMFFGLSPLMGAAYINKKLTRRVQMGSFGATRPLSDVEIAFAKLRLAVKSHLLSMAIMFAAIAIIILRSQNNVILRDLWARVTAQQGAVGFFLSLIVLLVSVTAASWAAGAYCMSLQLFGEVVDRKKHGWKISLGVVALFLLFVDAGAKLYLSRKVALAWLHSPHYQLLIPAVVLVAVGLCLLRRLRRVHGLGALRGIGAGIGAAAALCLLAVWPLNLSFGYQWALSCLVITIALLTAIPFLLVPVLIDLGRHR